MQTYRSIDPYTRMRRCRTMSTRFGSAAAVLAAAWAAPHRCCQALRAAWLSKAAAAGHHYFARGAMNQRNRMATSRLIGGVTNGVRRRRFTNNATSATAFSAVATTDTAAGLTRSSTIRSSMYGGSFAQRVTVGLGPSNRGCYGRSLRMISGEGPFFSDPEAQPEINGVGPVGPLAGSEQVRGTPLCAVTPLDSIQRLFERSPKVVSTLNYDRAVLTTQQVHEFHTSREFNHCVCTVHHQKPYFHSTPNFKFEVISVSCTKMGRNKQNTKNKTTCSVSNPLH